MVQIQARRDVAKIYIYTVLQRFKLKLAGALVAAPIANIKI